MNKIMTKAVLGATLAATALTVAAPAEAQRYRRGYDRDNGAGTAIIAGVAGLAIGAAIASSNDNRDRYYRDDYYNYNNNYRYNDYNYPRYNNNYYYRERYVQRCRVERRYDPYYGRTTRVRVCY